jgi:hypothetical protein
MTGKPEVTELRLVVTPRDYDQALAGLSRGRRDPQMTLEI